MDKVKVLLETNALNHSDLISVLSFYANLRMAFNNSIVHEGATVWVIPYFFGKTPCHAYQARLSSSEDATKYHRRKGDKITTYPEVVHYLLSTYTSREVIKEADNSVRELVQEVYRTTIRGDITETLQSVCRRVFGRRPLGCTGRAPERS